MNNHDDEWREQLQGRCLWHVTPLHYVPAILAAGALYSKNALASTGISPRPSAQRRDGMLGLTDCVHFSFTQETPLLADKLARGYPHVLFCFDASALAELPHALLPYNTKAWRTKACYEPVTEAWDKCRLLREHDFLGRHPSLEFLVVGHVSLSAAARIVFVTDAERCRIAYLAETLSLPLPAPLTTDGALAPEDYQPVTSDAIASYFDACRLARRVLPPPKIAFD